MPFGFGRKSLEEQLSESGRRASAEVLSSEPTKHFDSSYGNQLNGRSWILRMRVSLSGEQPFEVELKANLKILFMPRPGDSIDVLYDPGDHSRVVIDPALDLAPRPRVRSGVRAEVALPRGREAVVEAQSAPLEHRAELERFAQFYANGALSDDEYKELRRRILGLPEPTVVATGFQGRGGKIVVVERVVDSPGPDGGAPEADPLDEIGRLAELRDSGALSVAEFDARKRALLGEG
jgi:hypothetical protein